MNTGAFNNAPVAIQQCRTHANMVAGTFRDRENFIRHPSGSPDTAYTKARDITIHVNR